MQPAALQRGAHPASRAIPRRERRAARLASPRRLAEAAALRLAKAVEAVAQAAARRAFYGVAAVRRLRRGGAVQVESSATHSLKAPGFFNP